MSITGKTQLICLIGSPVSHSISPAMHNEAFRELNLDYAYLCFDIKESEMADAVKALRLLNVRGFNCTMPAKVPMCALSDELSPAASMIGAVNTVVNDHGRLIGHNTDGIGYMQAVREAGHDIIGQKMTLLGAGGAATAIAVQAALDGVKEIAIFNRHGRSWERGQKLVDTINTETHCQASLYDLADATEMRHQLSDSVILTNGTSVGMAPHTEDCPLADLSGLHEGLIVSDVIYNPRETFLMKEAAARGCSTFNGLYMLLYLGAEAFYLWTGQDMPVAHIKEKFFS